MVEVTQEDIRAAALQWCGQKDRETSLDDIRYFENNWHSSLGLRSRVQAFARHREAALTTAQAEADALRAEVERLSYDGIHTCHDGCPRLPCVQRREIERLREALEMLAPSLDYLPHPQCVEAIDAVRAALSEPTT
jgi:hypothetical protein